MDFTGDEFKPGSDSSGEEDDSSGVDENDVSDIDHESEIDSPIKVCHSISTAMVDDKYHLHLSSRNTYFCLMNA